MPRKRKLKTPDIKAGDVVKVINPHFFVRCGYPLDFNEEVDKTLERDGKLIKSFLKVFGHSDLDIAVMPKMQYKIASALTYESCRKRGWGGNQRTIHTEHMPLLQDVCVEVTNVRFVKTGVRCPGYVDHWGEYDGPYLSNETTHRILELRLQDEEYNYLEIDAANVEKVSGHNSGS